MNKCTIILIWSMAITLSAFAQNDASNAGFQSSSESSVIVLKSTIAGTPTRGRFVPNPSSSMDFNGDGVPDISFNSADKSSPKLFEIVDGADPENRWTVLAVSGNEEVALDFSRAGVIGFYELDGSNYSKEIILAEKRGPLYVNPIIVDVDGNLVSDMRDGTSNTVLVTVDHMDADITEEIVVFNPQIPQVEIWGVQTD